MDLKLKRIYDIADDNDGYRVLVDRLWPRGIRKENARVDLWIKELAPTTELRRWFSHDITKWDEFYKRYRQELSANPAFGDFVSNVAQRPVVTLLFGAKDIEHNNAVVLADAVREAINK